MKKVYVATIVSEYTVVFVTKEDSPSKLEQLAKKYAAQDQADSGLDNSISEIQIREISSMKELSDKETKFLAPTPMHDLGDYGVYGCKDISLEDIETWLKDQ